MRFFHGSLLSLAILAVCCMPGRGESLEDAWSVALAQNAGLAAAQLEAAAASHDLSGAAAERIPTVVLRGGYTIRSDEPNFVIRDPLPGLGTFEFPYAQSNTAAAGAEMRVPLYTSGRIGNSILCAESRHTATKQDAAQARLDLLFAVGEAYVTVVRVERALEVAKRELESLEADAADVSRLFAEQRVPQSDVLDIQAAATAAQQRCSDQQRTLDVARGRYNRLLGRPLSAPVALQEITLPKLEWPLDQLVQIAYDNRPDLLSLLAIAQSHDYASDTARAAAGPQVTASVGAQYEENRYANPQSLATAAVIVDWKLFDARADSTADAERTRAASIRRQVDDLKSQVALDLLNAWNQSAQADEQRELANQRLAYATESLRVTRLRYGRGLATNAAVLKALAQWSQATCDFHDAVYNGVLAQLQIRYSAGIL
jgi:outer membrane protein TolC